MNKQYYEILLRLAKKAYKNNEIPVSAFIEYNGKIIAKSYNKRYKSSNPLNHAEIRCIIKASKKLKDWRLSDCNLYVTLEPCHMCKEIIKESRIKNVYYLLSSEKNINYKTKFQHIEHYNNKEIKDLLTIFFENLRN